MNCMLSQFQMFYQVDVDFQSSEILNRVEGGTIKQLKVKREKCLWLPSSSDSAYLTKMKKIFPTFKKY